MHMKRLAMPKTWPLPRKGKKRFVSKGRGSLPLELSLPLTVFLRDILKAVETGKEAKKVVKEGNIIVDGRTVKDEKYRVGLFDRIYIKKMDKAFTITIEKKKLKAVEIGKESLKEKEVKVIGKKTVKGGKIQINLYDGKNLLMEEKEAKNIKVHDSLLLDLEKNKVVKHLKLEKNAKVFVIKGKHLGEKARVKEVNKDVVLTNGKEFKVPKENVFVIR